MNRYSMYLRLCIACVVSLWAGNYSLQAQGFFSPMSGHNIGSFIDAIYDFPVNGYRVNLAYDPSIVEYNFHFGRLDLDALGHETGWDSTTFYGDEYSRYFLLPDNNILQIQSSIFSAPANWDIYKLNWTGDTIWHYAIPKTFTFQSIHAVKQNVAGEIFISGTESTTPDPNITEDTARFFILKFNSSGSLLWQKSEQHKTRLYAALYSSMILTQDSGCIYSLHYLEDTLTPETIIDKLEKLKPDGTVAWSEPLHIVTNLYNETNSGELIYADGSYSSYFDMILRKRGGDGQLIWSKGLNATLNEWSVVPFSIISSQNGDIWMVVGKYINNNLLDHVLVARLTADGTLIWKKTLGFFEDNWLVAPFAIAVTPDDGLLVTSSFGNNPTTGFVLKITANGDILPGKIQGNVSIDANINCLVDPDEQAPVDWKVKLSSTDLDLFTTVDSVGEYQMSDIPAGDYNLSVVMPSNLWESCPDSVQVSFLDTIQPIVTQDFAIQTIADCPFMSVDIATPILRRCMQTTYYINYCNLGTIAAENTNVDVLLDPLLIFQSASIPVTQSADTLHFALGSVPALACGTFTFEVQVDCAAELGQGLCVQAHISPDTICNPAANWTGATLEASGHCDADSIRFQLRNVGKAASSNGLKFIVIDDHVITRESAIPVLNPAQSIWVSAPSNGDTWRFIADQEPNHPFEETPNVGVEGCGTGASGGQTFGFLLQFPNQDGNPFTDEDCRMVVGSYDPNDKSAAPQGLHAAHEIEPNQPIEYMIRFQNTGTDTAFTVVLRDTLDPALDVASLRPGAASHPYKWTLNGQNILTVTFENILLPDSFVNEAASHGFFQFKIDQKRDNPNLTRIENRAGIYFDFNAVVRTNTVFHTVKKDLLPAFETPARVGLPVLQLLPNPAVDQTLVWAEEPLHIGQTIRVRDLYGRVVRDIPVTGPQVLLQRNGLSSGVYMLGLLEEGKMIAGGKLVWVNP